MTILVTSLNLACQRFFLPHMDRDIRDYIYKSPRCVISKTADQVGRTPLEGIKGSAPEIVCVDF